MPLQVYELFVAETANRFRVSLPKMKLIFDLSLLGASVFLALLLFGDVTEFDWKTIGYSSFHSIGLGTLITTFINAPIITVMGKILDKVFDPTPRFVGLEKALKIYP